MCQKLSNNYVTVKKHTLCPLINLDRADALAPLVYRVTAAAKSLLQFRLVYGSSWLFIAHHTSCHPVCIPLLDLSPQESYSYDIF